MYLRYRLLEGRGALHEQHVPVEVHPHYCLLPHEAVLDVNVDDRAGRETAGIAVDEDAILQHGGGPLCPRAATLMQGPRSMRRPPVSRYSTLTVADDRSGLPMPRTLSPITAL